MAANPNLQVSQAAFGDIGAATSDIFAGFAENYKIQGAELEAQNYGIAAQLAQQNEQYTATSTALKEAQTSRELNLSLGKTQAEVAGAGLSLSGSALDILRSSAQQGALQKAAVAQQGAITEAGYAEQAQSYLNMQQAANAAVKGDELAQIGSFVGGGLQAAAGIAAIAAL